MGKTPEQPVNYSVVTLLAAYTRGSGHNACYDPRKSTTPYHTTAPHRTWGATLTLKKNILKILTRGKTITTFDRTHVQPKYPILSTPMHHKTVFQDNLFLMF